MLSSPCSLRLEGSVSLERESRTKILGGRGTCLVLRGQCVTLYRCPSCDLVRSGESMLRAQSPSGWFLGSLATILHWSGLHWAIIFRLMGIINETLNNVSITCFIIQRNRNSALLERFPGDLDNLFLDVRAKVFLKTCSPQDFGLEAFLHFLR